MTWLKVSLFVLTVASVKFIFKFINDWGDQRIEKMKELVDFAEYLRIYSCRMKMPFEDIYSRYEFRSDDSRKVCKELMEELSLKNSGGFLADMVGSIMMTPDDFNSHFAEIADYYGSTYSDILDEKLGYTIKEMERSMKRYEATNSEKKNLNNRISLLAGCLAAVILI